MKTPPVKLPLSIYILFLVTILANLVATFIMIKYLLQ